MRAHRWVALGCAAVLVACQSTEPGAPSIVGSWNLASFSDSGTVGVTTGTMTFAAGGAWSVVGTVTYPGEPLDSLVASGTWSQQGTVLTLAPAGSAAGTWDMAFAGAELVLTARPPLFTVIALTRP